MATSAPDECSLCTEKYDESEKAPRCLPCIHSFCTECIDNLILRQTKVCPFCRQQFQASSARLLGINIGLLDVLKLLREKEEKLLELRERGSASHSTKETLEELKREQGKFTKKIMKGYHKAEEKINSTIQSMKDLRENLLHEGQILTKVKRLLENNIQKVQFVEEQIKRLETEKEVMISKQPLVIEAITNLDAANTFTQAGPLIDKAEDANNQAQMSLETLNYIMFSNGTTLQIMKKAAEDTREKMSVIQEVLNSLVKGKDGLSLLPDMQQGTIRQQAPQQITIADVRLRNDAVLSLIRQGKVYAQQGKVGKKRHARITLDKMNRICLHYLGDERLLHLPDDALFLQHSDLMTLMNPNSRLFFLDMSHKERGNLGRIYINVFPNGKTAEQFTLLCTALREHKYTDTDIVMFGNHGFCGEYMVLGDYEHLGGRGGRELISKVWKEGGGVYERPWLAGTVHRCWREGERTAAQFVIRTRDRLCSSKLDHCFGQVAEGLEVVSNVIAQLPDRENVLISDTGIVLDTWMSGQARSTEDYKK